MKCFQSPDAKTGFYFLKPSSIALLTNIYIEQVCLLTIYKISIDRSCVSQLIWCSVTLT